MYRTDYKIDKRTRIYSAVICFVIAAAIASLLLFVDNGYFKAWTFFVFMAIILLYVLSIPRYIYVDENYFEIHCLVEMTRIDIRDIKSAELLERDKYPRPIFLLLGSFGFFGYYGYYFDLNFWDYIKVYASERNNLVIIEDIYEQKYIVSACDPFRLIHEIESSKNRRLASDKDAIQETDNPQTCL